MRDAIIRQKLKASNFHEFIDSESKIVDELEIGFGDSRIDVAVINGSLHGYEIKSNHDTLSKLERQISDYSRAFNFVTCLVGDKLIKSAKKIVPAWCGLIEVRNCRESEFGISFEIIQSPKQNEAIDIFTVAQFLWKDECVFLLNKKGVIKGVTSKSRLNLWRMIPSYYSLPELCTEVRKILKSRETWKVN